MRTETTALAAAAAALALAAIGSSWLWVLLLLAVAWSLLVFGGVREKRENDQRDAELEREMAEMDEFIQQLREQHEVNLDGDER